jgi:hypothetical protein
LVSVAKKRVRAAAVSADPAVRGEALLAGVLALEA